MKFYKRSRCEKYKAIHTLDVRAVGFSISNLGSNTFKTTCKTKVGKFRVFYPQNVSVQYTLKEYILTLQEG